MKLRSNIPIQEMASFRLEMFKEFLQADPHFEKLKRCAWPARIRNAPLEVSSLCKPVGQLERINWGNGKCRSRDAYGFFLGLYILGSSRDVLAFVRHL